MDDLAIVELTVDHGRQSLLAQGRTDRGARYALGSHHGDAELLAERLGRPTTRDDEMCFENAIRNRLDEAYESVSHLVG
jgi:hypothetical protein